jgi:hypothetical protein
LIVEDMARSSFKFLFEEIKLVLVIVQEWYLILNDLGYVCIQGRVYHHIGKGDTNELLKLPRCNLNTMNLLSP